MIRIHLPPAPAHYESQVLIPGLSFLAANPHPSGDDWNGHHEWRHIHDYLYSELRGVCAYCATYTPRRPEPRSIDHTSIDHFVPKSLPPYVQAYEWANFRLCRARLNHRKGNFQDVIDPCHIQNGWFRLNFRTFALSPDPNLLEPQKQRVRDTITRLELNDDDAYVNERARAIYGYADGKLPFDNLARHYPFIAAEMTSQNFDLAHLPTFKGLLKNPRLRSALTRQGWLA